MPLVCEDSVCPISRLPCGTRQGSADLDYYVTHPILAGGGQNIVYEVHVYDSSANFESRFLGSARHLPVIVGAFGPNENMTLADASALMLAAEAQGIPYLAWTFHTTCSPNLIAAPANASGCVADIPLLPTEWGRLVTARLEVPW